MLNFLLKNANIVAISLCFYSFDWFLGMKCLTQPPDKKLS